MTLKHYRKNPVALSPDDDKSRKIHLRISGFYLQQTVQVSEIAALIDALPDAHVAGLRGILYDPRREMVNSWLLPARWRWPRIAKSCKGLFDQRNRYILIFDFDDREEFFHILLHELGHYVFAAVLDSVTRKRWVTQVYKSAGFISRVAGRNAAEDFAECFAGYVLQADGLKLLPAKFEFMRVYVFGGLQDMPRMGVDLKA